MHSTNTAWERMIPRLATEVRHTDSGWMPTARRGPSSLTGLLLVLDSRFRGNDVYERTSARPPAEPERGPVRTDSASDVTRPIRGGRFLGLLQRYEYGAAWDEGTLVEGE